ncbi:cytochrome P450 [Aspergillus avenaceus]|uniref:Cytochrome P450 n=1 Tax=Aspergillus avenaceus TaxID=36643 RepID=A0A5N6U4E6_ASPAV|nr:cytochrome P450 [Aspergillus avenaceus]
MDLASMDYDFNSTKQQFLSHQRPPPTARPSVLIAITLVVLVLVKKVLANKRAQRKIVDTYGCPIRELPMDTRVMKFAMSQQISEQGKAVAGDAPFMIRNGRSRELVLTKPDHIRSFYKGDMKHHPKPPYLNMGEYFKRILGHAVGAISGERWSMIRRYFDPEFSFHVARQSGDQFKSIIAQWVKDLPRYGVPVGRGFKLEVQGPCRFLPFQLVSQHIYGQVFSEKLFDDLLSLNTLHEVILFDVILNTRLTSKIWNWFDRSATRRMNEFNSKWKKFNMDIVNTARRENLNCPAERIFSGVDKNEMKVEEFLHTLDEILFANVDVSSALLNTLFQHLAANPTIQQNLREEIALYKSQDPNDQSQYMSKTDTLLNFVVMEGMRFSPAFAFSLPECTSTAKEIGGYHIPANTPVVIDAKRLNGDPDSWGKDSDEFRPERFHELPISKTRCQFMRFGVGAASGRCLGKNVADLIFKLTLMTVLEQFSLHAVEDNPEIEFRPLEA